MIVPGSANALMLGQQSGAYTIAKSLRWRRSASAWLSRTPSSAGNQQKFTWSGWVKRGQSSASTSNQILFGCATATNNYFQFGFDSGASFTASSAAECLGYVQVSGGNNYNISTNAVFRDYSAWYHIIIAFDTTQATDTNRVKIYVNGVQQTINQAAYPPQNANMLIDSTITHGVGYANVYSNYFDGYMTEVNFIDGQALTPSSFGANDTTTGVWQPKKYTGTYGTNGFYLPFTDTSSTSPTGLGKDFSGASSNVIVGSATNASTTLTVVSTTGISVGNIVTGTGIPSNTYVTAIGVLQVTLSQAATSTTVSNNYTFSGNNWTCNNISLTAGSTYDSMTDVPTLTSATTANTAVINPLNQATGSFTAANGNLQFTATATNSSCAATIIPTSGKWYAEAVFTTGGSSYYSVVGVVRGNTTAQWYTSGGGVFYESQGNKRIDGTSTAYGASWATGDVVGIAVDIDGGTVTFYKNNSSQGSISLPSSTTGWTFSLGDSHAGGGSVGSINFGQQPFTYTPPTGYVALNTYNLPTNTIVKGNTVMDATTYTGTGASLSVTNAGFKPDLVWIKSRSAATDHKLTDSVRGTTKALISDTTGAETTDANGLTAFGTSGFTVGTDTVYNNNTATFVGWQWQAGQGTTSSNTNGSITSTVSVNATAGFSIVTYTGTGVNATVGHGLGVAPSFIIVKTRSNVDDWQTYNAVYGKDYAIQLNKTSAIQNVSNYWYNGVTSSVFGVNGSYSGINANGYTYVAYCWAEIAGFSKFGSYTGNGSSDGPFIYTGFRPKFIMLKLSSSSGEAWLMYDTSRNIYNVMGSTLRANDSIAEDTNVAYYLDGVSNGFKLRASASNVNTNGATYIYMAFAENPFKNALAR